MKNIIWGTGLALLVSFSSTDFASKADAQIKIVGGGLGGGFSRSISVTNENGMKTTRVTENGKKFVIREGEGRIEVEFANSYGPKDLEKLKEKHPDLHMHVTSFPKKTGDSAVELTISVKEKVTGENESELKEKSEEAYAIFEKFTKQSGGLGGPFGKLDLELRGIEIGKPARLIEIEKDVQKKVEEMKKKVEEMRKKALGGAIDESEKSDRASKVEQEESDKAKSEKKDLIKT